MTFQPPPLFASDPQAALLAMQEVVATIPREAHSPPVQRILLTRVVGPWGADLRSVHLPPVERRRQKRDTLFVLSDEEPVWLTRVSTWPFDDKHGPYTKLLMPGWCDAAWCKGWHGKGENKRRGLVWQGHSRARTWCYGLDGRPMGTIDPDTKGLNFHTDLGDSEACITAGVVEHTKEQRQAIVDNVLRHLVTGSRVHSAGDPRECFDVCLIHVEEA